jgi:hypothetical protein
MTNKNIIIFTHMYEFSWLDGGTVVQYLLAKTLEEMNQTVRIFPSSGIQRENPIFAKYYDEKVDFPIDDNCVVIYCEGTQGNPLNAKYVVRWMLSELGQNVPASYLDGWTKDELVYYFNSEKKFYTNPDKIGTIYKMLNIIYINPNALNYRLGPRNGCCYTTRKMNQIHKSVKYIHKNNAFEITRDHTQKECIYFFNRFKMFVCYDPISFMYVISALCGCPTVVYKIAGVSKEEWLKKTICYEYFKHIGKYQLYGIAYGIEELPYAVQTLHLVKQQWNHIFEYSKKQTVVPFINEIQDFASNVNTIQNNF